MILILYITSFLIIFYLIYPLFLLTFGKTINKKSNKKGNIDSISLLLLTYNGVDCLSDKIRFLSEELSTFNQKEFIIIDDNSKDGTSELLEKLKEYYDFKLIQKDTKKGIASSMNMFVSIAKFEYLIFCDQRQHLNSGVLKQLIEPLKNDDIGAVSAYISNIDKNNKKSFFRMHENYLKSLESNMGCLIGVYGPLYSIKKACYFEIPESIILDDLYLSLKILSTNKIKLIKTCVIVDENFSELNNFTRSKRYLKGLIQILFEKQLIRNLDFKLQLMLFWHKYLRLLIPPFVFMSYLLFTVESLTNYENLMLLFCITILPMIFLILSWFKIYTSIISELLKTNFNYLFSITTMLFPKFQVRKLFQINYLKNKNNLINNG